ncbi:MAG: hypothetical protein QXF76_00570 [Candidatus Anstonellales archaeon]
MENIDKFDKYSSIQKLLCRLYEGNEFPNDKTAIIVEGKKDKLALEELHVNLPIFECARDKYKLVETLAKHKYTKAILLLDLDKNGNRLASELSEMLLAQGIKPNTYYRKLVGKFLKLKYFEEMQTKIAKFNEYTMR